MQSDNSYKLNIIKHPIVLTSINNDNIICTVLLRPVLFKNFSKSTLNRQLVV